MATEIVRWCDPCMADDTRTPGAAHTVQVDGKTGNVDLCDQHAKALLGPLLEFVQVARRTTQKEPVGGAKTGRRQIPGDTPCPVCGDLYRADRVAPHALKMHGTNAAALAALRD